MRPRHRFLSLMLLLLWLSLVPRSEAAISVVEVGPQLAASQTTAVQSTITAIQSILIVANQILELTALEGILQLGEDLGPMLAIVEEAQALGFDLTSLQAQISTLFGLEAAVGTSVELATLMIEQRHAMNRYYVHAMRAQTLISTVLRTVEHILAIIEHAGQAIGNLSISQTMSEAQSKLQQLLAEAHVRQTMFERARTADGAAATVQAESVRRIHEQRMADHPR